MHPKELRAAALHWLTETQPQVKASGVAGLFDAWMRGELKLEGTAVLVSARELPGRPLHPELVSPLELKARSMRTELGRAAMIHALAHIEFNAINLALDTIWRFAEMPEAFYADFLRVAKEEALHFVTLAAHLATLGFQYGDFPAHNGLWEMAERTKDDVLARIALVPRMLEARGLDATPAVQRKLAQAGDRAAAQILDVILRDEIGHVAIGNRWFAWLCAEQKIDPIVTHVALAAHYRAPKQHPPFNLDARRAAGFSERELAALTKGAV